MSQEQQVWIRKCLFWWVNGLTELSKLVVGSYALIYSSACPSVLIAWLSVPMLVNAAIKLFLPLLPLLLVLQGEIVYHHCESFLNIYIFRECSQKTYEKILLLPPTDFFCSFYGTGEPKSTLLFLIAVPQNKLRGMFPHGSFTWRLQCTKITTPSS